MLLTVAAEAWESWAPKLVEAANGRPRIVTAVPETARWIHGRGRALPAGVCPRLGGHADRNLVLGD